MTLVALGTDFALILYKKKVLGHDLDLADAFLIPGAEAGVGIFYLLITGNPLSSLMTAAMLIPILAGLAVLGLFTKFLMIAKRDIMD